MKRALYRSAIERLLDTGVQVQSIVCDGRKGLTKLFPGIPVQLCHFHQIQTINRYLTRRPKSFAASSLRHIARSLSKVNKATFLYSLNDWHHQYKEYLNERFINEETGKTWFTHKRLRSAYNSLRNNIDLLFTFEEFKELNIT